jgi:hypothetical protein
VEHRIVRRFAVVAAVPAATLAVASCGGGAPASAPAPTRPSTRGFVSAAELERDLGNGFRRGLAQGAVMAQRGDDAVDLGQPLPTGLVDDVSCAPAGPRPAGGAFWRWRCRVRWRTAASAPRRTAYEVRLFTDGCFSAGARPRFGDRYDPTIRSFAEDPLNAIVSARSGC